MQAIKSSEIEKELEKLRKKFGSGKNIVGNRRQYAGAIINAQYKIKRTILDKDINPSRRDSKSIRKSIRNLYMDTEQILFHDIYKGVPVHTPSALKEKKDITFNITYKCHSCGYKGAKKDFYSWGNSSRRTTLGNDNKCPRCKKYRTVIINFEEVKESK